MLSPPLNALFSFIFFYVTYIHDPGYGWVVVAGATLSQLLIFGYGRQFGVFYIHFLEEFQKSAAETAWVGALFQVSSQILGEVINCLITKPTLYCQVLFYLVFLGFIYWLNRYLVTCFSTKTCMSLQVHYQEY